MSYRWPLVGNILYRQCIENRLNSRPTQYSSRTREGCWNIKGSLYSVHYPVTVAPKNGVAGENRVTGDNRVAGENMGAGENGVADENRGCC